MILPYVITTVHVQYTEAYEVLLIPELLLLKT